jgi:hypothetical protein
MLKETRLTFQVLGRFARVKHQRGIEETEERRLPWPRDGSATGKWLPRSLEASNRRLPRQTNLAIVVGEQQARRENPRIRPIYSTSRECGRCRGAADAAAGCRLLTFDTPLSALTNDAVSRARYYKNRTIVMKGDISCWRTSCSTSNGAGMPATMPTNDHRNTARKIKLGNLPPSHIKNIGRDKRKVRCAE